MLFEKFNQSSSSLYDLRFLVMCFLGFAGFFRIQELLSVQLKNVLFTNSHIEITLEKSKCDQHRDGQIVFISKIDSQYCPVRLLLKFLTACKIDYKVDSSFFVIPRLFKAKKGYSASKTLGISYSRAREIFLEKLNECNIPSNKYGLHSLRSGGASAASSSGVDERLISKHGRWKSDVSKNGYIKDSLDKRLKISKSLNL